MKILIRLLFLSLFLISWDLPDSYKTPDRKSFKGSSSNNHFKYIPSNTFALTSFHLGEMMNKMAYDKIMETELMDYMFNEMREEGIPRKIRNFIKDPNLLGFDLNQPIYSFVSADFLDVRFSKNLVAGSVIPIEDYDLFDLNVASLIDLIPDRDVDIIQGKLNDEFNYTLFRVDSYRKEDLDLFILCYNKENLILLANVDVDGNGQDINLKSLMKRYIFDDNQLNKPGINEINKADINFWGDVSIYSSLINEIYEDLFWRLSDDEIRDLIQQTTQAIDRAPYCVISANSKENNLSFSFKSIFSEEGKDYFEDYSKIINQKIGNEILNKISSKNIGMIGASFDVLEFKRWLKYQNDFDASEIDQAIDQLSIELNVSPDNLWSIFKGNTLFSVYDIDIVQEQVDGIVVAGLNNPDVLIKIIYELYLEGKLPPYFGNIEKYEPLEIRERSMPQSFYILIDDNFLYLGSKNAIRGIDRNSNKMNKIINNKPEDMNAFFTLSMNELLNVIPNDDREIREFKSFARDLKLGSFAFEILHKENEYEMLTAMQINSGNKNPLEFIIFNLIPLIEDEISRYNDRW